MEEQIIFSAISPEYYPEYKTSGSAGGDLRTRLDVIIPAHETIMIPSGLKVAVPEGYTFLVEPRSSTLVKKHLLINVGVIDSDFRGEIKIVAHNLGDTEVKVEAGERLAQGFLVKIPSLAYRYTANFDKFAQEYPTERGEGGIGSTGKF